MVSDLMLPSGGWNESLVFNSFNHVDATLITSIPIGDSRLDDQIRWFWEKDGKYKVRSGYKLALSIHKTTEGRGECSNVGAKKKFWNSLWGLEVPNKVKLFLWRAASNILPCGQNLAKRNISPSPICFICNKNEETPFHAICKCNLSKKIWNLTPWRNSFKVHFDYTELLADFFVSMRYENMELFAYIAWLVWNERNKCWHGKVACSHPEEVVSKATALLEEFKETNKERQMRKANRNERWSPPPEGFYKLNTDGAVDGANGKRGLGAIIRNENGELMGAFASPIFGSFSPLVTELLALKAGLKFAIDIGTLPIIVETDCSEAIRLVNSFDHCWSEEGLIVADVKALMYDTGVSSISFQPRECNTTAHCTAKFALSEHSVFTCIEYGPQWLMESINNDSNDCNLSPH